MSEPKRYDSTMTNDQYMSLSGQKIASRDLAEGRPGQHRDVSNSPAYRDAYDSVIASSRKALNTYPISGVLVCTSSYSDVVDTARRIISETMYAGRPAPSPLRAIAAAYSVPDGAPIAMAADNVGVEMDDASVAHFEKLRASAGRGARFSW